MKLIGKLAARRYAAAQERGTTPARSMRAVRRDIRRADMWESLAMMTGGA
jgi:hypothetical protein